MTVRVMHMLHTLEIGAGDTGSTVRKGFKWAQQTEPGGYLRLCVCQNPCLDVDICGFGPWSCDNCGIEGTGVVDKVWVGRFRDIPAYLLSFEHERRSREYWGLFDSMRKAYGDEFSESDFVTVLIYDRTS